MQEGVRKENSDHSEGESGDVEFSSDVRGLLHWSSSLLRSQNSVVVMAVAGIYWVFAPAKDLKNIVKPLLFLLRSSCDSQYVVRLQNSLMLSSICVKLVADCLSAFLLSLIFT